MLGFIARISSNFHDSSCFSFLYNSLVSSRLEYNSSVRNPHQIKYRSKIENVQRVYTRILQFKLNHNPQSYNNRLIKYNLIELEKRRMYFDICLLHNTVHEPGSCLHSRPIFRINQYSNRKNIHFCPHISRTDFGLHKNQIMRSQILYNKYFGTVDILQVNKLTFRGNIIGAIKTITS